MFSFHFSFDYSARFNRLPALAMVFCLLVSACAPAPALRRDPAQASIQYPAGPVPASIEWVRAISHEQDAGITKGFWRRLVDLVAGGTKTGIVKPYGVFHDESRLIIVDTGFAVVHIMDMKDNRYSILGSGKEGSFQIPIAVTGDDGGHLYITDSAAGVVYRYNLRKGILVPFARLQRPTGIAFNRRTQHLYVTDTVAHQIVIFDLAGVERARIGERGTAPGSLNYPTDLFIDNSGTLYVTDPLNARVQVFSEEGAYIKTIGGIATFSKPKGIAVDSAGHIYVCDALLDVVRVFDQKGTSLLDFGGRGSGDGEFWMPAGIYIDNNDMIFVADTYNRRIQVFRYTGEAPLLQ